MKENIKKIYIIGAHSRAKTLGVYLKSLNPAVFIEAYLVDNDEVNEKFIDGVPVVNFNESTELHKNYPVYIGTRGIYHDKFVKKLTNMGMKEIIPITPELDIEFRNKYLSKYYAEKDEYFDKFNEYCSVCVYVAKSIFDKPMEKEYSLAFYNREIQVGAALTDKRISLYTDDKGYNISEKNKQFCELTALYWIWKNARQDIVGLEHYRRHFILHDNWIEKMQLNNIDVILPTPLYVSPSIVGNYKDRHIADDWNYMMKAFNILYPEQFEEANKFFETNLYSPCNMFIMRKSILDELCNWMFPILFLCVEHIGEREDGYQNRYPGFLAERLMSYFFERNRDKYRIVYTDKNFMV